MNRSHAFEELKLRLENPSHIRHSLAVEAIMTELAKHLHEDREQWGLAGLVHDIDLERIGANMALHGMMGGDILEGLDFHPTIVYAVRAHNDNNNIPRRRKIDKALYCATPMADLITACVLSQEEKKLDLLDEDIVMSCFCVKEFASGINREQIAACKELGLTIEELVRLSLAAMKKISSQLGF